MLRKSFLLTRPKGLPKSALRVLPPVYPDVRLDQRRWVLYHRNVNHIDVRLASVCAPLGEGAHAAHPA